jgi:hypothetical protein
MGIVYLKPTHMHVIIVYGGPTVYFSTLNYRVEYRISS